MMGLTLTWLLETGVKALLAGLAVAAGGVAALLVMRLLGTTEERPDGLAQLIAALLAYSVGMHLGLWASITLLQQFSLEAAVDFAEKMVASTGTVAGFIVHGYFGLIPRTKWRARAALPLAVVFCTPWFFLAELHPGVGVVYFVILSVSALVAGGWKRLRGAGPERAKRRPSFR